MLQSARDRFLSYYNNELRYLRNAGRIFAKQHPKIARRLELSDKESPDPHIERLLESFAFMTARLSQEIDDRFPEVATALLSVLYPHLINPLPSMAIAHFQVDPTKGKLTTGYRIDKARPLFTYADEGVTCRFQTVYPVTLWPIKVKKAKIIEKNVYPSLSTQGQDNWFLQLTLESQGLNFSDLALDSLQFHIHADRTLSMALYESLFAQADSHLFFSVDGKTAHPLPENSLQEVGFSRDEMTLPLPEHSTHAYQLLQEYFHLPEKFLFFRLANLEAMRQKVDLETNTIEILLPLGQVENILHKHLTADHFLLGCTPIVNLFPKTTDPFRLDKRKTYYRLTPDQRRDRTTEIYSILSVSAALENTGESQVFSPYFSFDHQGLSADENVYWAAKRISAESRDLPGTDILLSFVDMHFNPALPPQQIVYARTLCTNRFLAEQLPGGAELQIEEAPPINTIICLEKPVSQAYSPLEGETLWRLVSQLSANHLALTMGENSVNILKENLKLYAGLNYSHRFNEIDCIKNLKTTKIVRRLGQEAWRGFVSGIEVGLDVQTSTQAVDSSFLLTSVLRHYLSLNVSINSFIEMTLHKNGHQEERMRWQPLLGEKILL